MKNARTPQHIGLQTLCLLLIALVHAPGNGLAQEDPILVIDPDGHSAIIKDIMFTPNGRILVSVSDDKTICLWDADSGQRLKTIRGQIGDGYEGELFAGALSPDGRTLAVAGYLSHANDGEYGRIRLINIETGEQTGLLKGQSGAIYSLAFSPDGKLLASGSSDQTVRIWEIGTDGSSNSGKAVATLEGHRDNIYGMDFAPDNSKVVSASHDHTLRLWRADSRGRFSAANFVEMKQHTAEARCVAWSPDGRYIVSGGYDGKILLWDGEGSFIKEIDRNFGKIINVAFSKDSKKAIGVGEASVKAKIYAIPSGERISSFTQHSNTVFASAFYGNDLVTTTGGNDNDIYIWQADSTTVKTHIVGKGKNVWAVAFGAGLQVAFGQSNTPGSLINMPLEKTFNFSTLKLDQQEPIASEFTRTRTTYLGRELKKLNDHELQIGNNITIKNDEGYDGRIKAYTFTNSRLD